MLKHMKNERLPNGFFEKNYGLTGCVKLLRQMEIADRRIRSGIEAVEGSLAKGNLPAPTRELELDTETFYIVAAAFLKLAARIIGGKTFMDDPVYKRIQSVRNQLITHAFERPDGVAYSGWGFGPSEGPVLKAGSGSELAQSGYYRDHANLLALMDKFGATEQGLGAHWSARVKAEATPEPLSPT